MDGQLFGDDGFPLVWDNEDEGTSLSDAYSKEEKQDAKIEVMERQLQAALECLRSIQNDPRIAALEQSMKHECLSLTRRNFLDGKLTALKSSASIAAEGLRKVEEIGGIKG